LSLNLFQTCMIIAINSLFWSLSVAGICFLIKRRQEAGQRMQHMRIEAVIEKMKGETFVKTADGSHVPRKKWRRVGNSYGHPGETKPPSHPGYYGSG
jgi:hypothetical protein